ncbi:hypothetical protein RSOLAG1IB_00441 [Rhizoctonia solani AG-1 IB]|jgi:hypothetical protein|uniref:Uncharacterized protein n=1 Tax=Thanatephorus cucumeris (strain AG1-IB / isolate 7/3/14) TaxID=1108050 RepID=A0A0B7F4M3_THACB|nr:hypothetical protein RSOLAG1IB_00441 [Rhizoctonia solani AG-1 IB]
MYTWGKIFDHKASHNIFQLLGMGLSLVALSFKLVLPPPGPFKNGFIFTLNLIDRKITAFQSVSGREASLSVVLIAIPSAGSVIPIKEAYGWGIRILK